MISKKEYDRISKSWIGKVYQKYKKLKKRLPIIERNIDFFKGIKVFELGSNAGMYGLHLFPYVVSYTGLECNEHYYKQSIETFKNRMVTLINDSFQNVYLDDIDFDLFLASYVLHHLNFFEMRKLNDVFEKCSKVAIHTRSGDPLRYGHEEIGCDPLKWWKGSMVKLMLEKRNYKIDFQLNKEGVHDGNYLILAEKKI